MCAHRLHNFEEETPARHIMPYSTLARRMRCGRLGRTRMVPCPDSCPVCAVCEGHCLARCLAEAYTDVNRRRAALGPGV